MTIKAIEASLQKTREVVKLIQERLNWHDRDDQTYEALRVVLHALRDRLPPAEATAFAAQLPFVLKGTFYDGWHMAKTPVKMDRQEFLDRIQGDFKLSVDGGIDELVMAVMDGLRLHMDAGEIEKIRKVLPEDLASLLG